MLDVKFWTQQINDALNNKTEYNFLDFKLSLSDKNERLKEHANAFGNLESGGCLIFGVKENFDIVGVKENTDLIINKLAQLASKTQEPSLTTTHFFIEYKQRRLLCIYICSSFTKPVFIKDRAPLGGKACFKRSGASTVAMPLEEIKDLLVMAQDNYYDKSPVQDTELRALDFKRLASLIPHLDSNNSLSERNIASLIDYSVLTGNQKKPQITVAAWLIFSKFPQEKRQFRNAYIEFQIFQGVARDNPIKKYDIKGNLSDQIEQSIDLLNQYIWRVPKIRGIKREEISAYPDIILREVITNSIVHRDYKRMHQPVKISMFSNRIEIENPGGLMPGLTTYNLVHKRDWRNPLIAELMKKFGFGEMDGQGIDRLYATTLSIKVPPPLFVEDQSAFTVVLSAPKRFEDFTPEEKRLQIIILVIMQEIIDNESVRNIFSINSEKASTLIKSMVADKVIEPNSSSRKYAKYVLTQQYKEKIFE